MRVALDTNILAYAEGVNGAGMKRTALALLEKLPQEVLLLPVGRAFFNLLVRKAGRAPTKARKAILSWKDAFPLIETSAEVLLAAADLATDHQLSIWDSSSFLPQPSRAAGLSYPGICRRDLRGEGARSQTRSPLRNTTCSPP
jgi:predicted nucleic acid-binding protein